MAERRSGTATLPKGAIGGGLSHAKPTTTLPVVNIARARKFYEGVLGFKPGIVNSMGPEAPDVMYESEDCCRIYLYQRAATKADHTVLSFEVENIESTMAELRSKGVVFEEYDMPGLKTVNGLAAYGPMKAAWFKDTEGNILNISESSK